MTVCKHGIGLDDLCHECNEVTHYIHDRDISDELVQKYGRIPAEFSDTGVYSDDPEERCIGKLIYVVTDPPNIKRFISDRGGRVWNHCRINKKELDHERKFSWVVRFEMFDGCYTSITIGASFGITAQEAIIYAEDYLRTHPELKAIDDIKELKQ